jgi:hypothetical protein
MKRIVSLLLITTAISCSGTKVGMSQDNSDPTKYMNSITADELKHLYIVASDEMEGRETGSAGQKKRDNIDQYKKKEFSKRERQVFTSGTC